LLALLVLSITFLLNQLAQIVLIMLVGPFFEIVVLVNNLGLDEELPDLLKMSGDKSGRVLVVVGLLLLLFMVVLGA